MRHSMISLCAIALATACASRPAAGTTTATAADDGHHPGHTVGTTPGTSGGDVVVACGDGQVTFASGSSELDDAARARLNNYAGCLSRHETDIVYVSGTTDPVGTTEDNLVLGRARARAVADHLHAAGCNVDFVIRTYGEGHEHPGEPLWPLARGATATAVVTP